MKKREKAVRDAVTKLDVSPEAREILVDIWREVDGAYAEQYAKQVADLKARLKACREAWFDAAGDDTDDERIPRATDLRVKNWRKP